MRTYIPKNYFKELELQLNGKGAWDITIELLNCYYHKCYKGEENTRITLEYLDYMFLDVLPLIGSNYEKLNQNEKVLKKLSYFLPKSLLNAKIQTYNKRRNYLWQWINFHKTPERYNNDSKMVLDLLEKYKSLNDLKEVKRELDLVQSLDTLKQQKGKLNVK